MSSYFAIDTSYLVECSSHVHIISNRILSNQSVSTCRSQITPSQTSESSSQTIKPDHLKPVHLYKYSLSARHLHGADDVLHEASLGAGIILLNVLAVLIGVHGNALVNGVVLPVAVEDLVDRKIRLIVGQLLQEFGSVPARDMFASVELARRDGPEVRKLGEQDA